MIPIRTFYCSLKNSEESSSNLGTFQNVAVARTRECETTMGISCRSQLITENGQKTEDPYIGYFLEDMRIP